MLASFTKVLCVVALLASTPVFAAKQTTGQRLYTKSGKALIAKSRAKSGDYYLQNVGTKEYMHYRRDQGQSFFAAEGKGDLVRMKPYAKYYTAMMPKTANKKCSSAQWNFREKANWGVALYGCVVGNFKRDYLPEWMLSERDLADGAEETDEDFVFTTGDDDSVHIERSNNSTLEARWNARDGPVRHAKQYWLVKKAKTSRAFNIIASDHVKDMKPRAFTGGCTVRAVDTKKAKYVCLKEFSENNKKQQWRLVRPNGRILSRDIQRWE